MRQETRPNRPSPLIPKLSSSTAPLPSAVFPPNPPPPLTRGACHRVFYPSVVFSPPPLPSFITHLKSMIPMLAADPASGHRSRPSSVVVADSWSEEVKTSALGNCERDVHNAKSGGGGVSFRGGCGHAVQAFPKGGVESDQWVLSNVALV